VVVPSGGLGHVAEEGMTASTFNRPVALHIMNNTYAVYSR
jgi:hypothetical protein